MQIYDLIGIKNFRHIRYVEDPRLEGEQVAEMNEGDDEIRVSPAMYKLIQTDLESMANSLRVRILPRRATSRLKK